LLAGLTTMFESIIQYFIAKGEWHERTAHDMRVFTAYLESQTSYTKAKLEEVIKKINHGTVKPDNDGCYPNLEFWRDVDDYGTTVYVEFGANDTVIDEIGAVVKGSYELEQATDAEKDQATRTRQSIQIDTSKFPLSQLGFSRSAGAEQIFYYAWIAYLWQEVEGHQCGLKVLTVQNNSIAKYSLNDFLVDYFSAYIDDNVEYLKFKIENVFPRKLSVVELFLRASQSGYPLNPYSNYWRYFEKGDQFSEIVTYELATGVRSGKLSEQKTAIVADIEQHVNPTAAQLHIANFSNRMIRDGWEEKLRPIGLPTRLHEKAYDFSFWTGSAWFDKKEKDNRLTRKAILAFEMAQGIKLPDALAQYLRMFNGRQNNKHLINFPVDDFYTVKVEKFYNIHELGESASVTLQDNPNYLWIGVLSNDALFGVCIQENDENYGKIALSKGGLVEQREYTFEKFAAYAQSFPVVPEIWAAQENDVEYLKKRLDEGWDYNTNRYSGSALVKAAEYNAHDTLELLLQRGATLGGKKSEKGERVYRSIYDEKTVELFEKYL